ncbi:MAG: STAS domain-containing protein [Gammaproteobacteria bacterium]
MLKITTTANVPAGILFIAEGRLVGPWVAELETALEAALGSARDGCSIDLSAVSFVDTKGIELLCRMRARGVDLRTVSPFVQKLLDSQP